MNLVYYSTVYKAKWSMVALFYMKYVVIKERLHKHSPAILKSLPACLPWNKHFVVLCMRCTCTAGKWSVCGHGAKILRGLTMLSYWAKHLKLFFSNRWWIHKEISVQLQWSVLVPLYVKDICVSVVLHRPAKIQSLGEQEANVLQMRTVTGAIWGRIGKQGR